MKALVVVESSFGNSWQVAEAIAAGLGAGAAVVGVADAVSRLASDLDLLVVGGPTHAFSMSRQSTREDAVRQGSTRPHTVGIREWIDTVDPSGSPAVATFDTRVHRMRHLPGSAAKAAAAALRRRGLRVDEPPQSFYVEGVDGPLVQGELVRARAWGVSLGERLAVRS